MESAPLSYYIIAGFYYALTGLLCFFSIFGVYVLIRHGQSKITALIVSLVYGFFFLTILSQSYGTLNLIK
jgi:hypothetical protein